MLVTPNKIILSIETSGQVCGVCLYRSEKDYITTALLRDRSHAAKLAPLIETTLHNFDLSISDIDVIAVSNGPGSFTGLRVGLSTAKGISLGAGLPIILVPTSEAIALQMLSSLPPGSEFVVCSKVNTSELYYTKFRNNVDSYQIVEPTQVLPLEKIKENLGKDDYLISEKNWFDIEKYVNLSSPNPLVVAQWAARFGVQIEAELVDFVEPYYFKEFIIKRK